MQKSYLIPVFLAIICFGGAAEALRVSLTPILGSAPVLYADEWGLFSEQGLDVKLIPLASQRDRLFAFQARQVDVVITDVTSVVLLAARSRPLVVSTAYIPEDPRKQFALVVQEKYSGLKSFDDLVAVLGSRDFFRISLPLQSDIEFATDMALKAHGIDPSPDLYFGQDNLFLMASMVVYGMVAAAVLPEPYASFSLKFAKEEGMGLRELEDFAGIPLLPHLIVFQRDFAERHPDAVRGFLRAFAAAIDRINRESKEGLVSLGAPEVLRLFYQGQNPEEVLSHPSVVAAIKAIPVPHFPELAALDPDVYEAVSAWARSRGYVRFEHPYAEVATDAFLKG